MRKIQKSLEIPDSLFDDAVRIESLALATMFGQAIEIVDDDGEEGVLLWLPLTDLKTVIEVANDALDEELI